MEYNTEISTLSSSANGTDDREARSFRWYAARTQMNCERLVEREFQAIASETYLPIQEEIHIWSDRKKKVKRVVIPMILFVKMNSKEATKVHRNNHFYGFISKNRHDSSPAPISDHDIETLRFMLKQSNEPVSIEQMPLKLGDKVEIVRGNLKGLQGHVLRSKDGSTHIVVKLDFLGCAKVSVSMSDLQLVS
jgi:transcription antitermination factor NusG